MNTQHDEFLEPYALLRTALALFQKPPAELNDEQRTRVRRQASNEFSIETLVLSSVEAASVVISDQEVERAFKEIKNRFEDEAHFVNALEANGLSVDSLRLALARQCKVDAVMESVASRAPKVNEVEIGIYYHSHPEKFHKPEQRVARHILISINPEYPENTREAAWQRINELAETLKRKPHKFADLALRHSECPTALHGGVIGTVIPGKLYPQLEEVLYALKVNQISPVVESEIGFHVLLCEKIVPAEAISLRKATPNIQKLMQERCRRNCQRTWLAALAKANP